MFSSAQQLFAWLKKMVFERPAMFPNPIPIKSRRFDGQVPDNLSLIITGPHACASGDIRN